MAQDDERTTRLERFDFETADLERADEYVRRAYARHGVRLLGPRERFVFAVQSVVSPELSLHVTRHSCEVEVVNAPVGRLAGFRLLKGSVSVQLGGDELLWRERQSGLFPLEQQFRMQSLEAEMEIVSVAPAASDLAAELVGGLPPGELRVRPGAAVSPELGRHWNHVVGFVRRELLAEQSAFDSALLRAEAARTVAIAALLAFPNNALDREDLREVGKVPPVALRRAVGFIEAHAAEPISVGDVAAAASIGVRGLQAGFTRHYGMSPMAYLRSVRLALAHRDLVAADPGSGLTVAEVARRWGFTPSHFAGAYRRHFGRQPHETLRE